MEIIRQNRIAAAVLGGLVVLIALVLIFNSGSDAPEGSTLPASDLPSSTGTATPFNPFAQRPDDNDPYPRPDIEPIRCGPLLDFADLDPVFDTTAYLTIGKGESCRHELVDDRSVFVRIEPGHPTDLLDGGTYEGESGLAVDGPGDVAFWFPAASTLVVAAEGNLGIVIFRVTVEVPRLDTAGRLTAANALAASALPRFPGVEAPPLPRPEEELEPPPESGDTSSFGYVQNLLERERAGEWTRGEGLVATLSLLTGDAQPTDVLRDPTIEDVGTATIELATEYLTAEPSSQQAPELEALLDRLLWVPTLQEDSAPADADLTPSGRRTATSAITRTQEPEELICETRSCDPPTCHWGLWFNQGRRLHVPLARLPRLGWARNPDLRPTGPGAGLLLANASTSAPQPRRSSTRNGNSPACASRSARSTSTSRTSPRSATPPLMGAGASSTSAKPGHGRPANSAGKHSPTSSANVPSRAEAPSMTPPSPSSGTWAAPCTSRIWSPPRATTNSAVAWSPSCMATSSPPPSRPTTAPHGPSSSSSGQAPPSRS